MRLLSLISICLSSTLIALPQGGEVMEGKGNISSSSSSMDIAAHGKAIVHWDQFDIQKHEKVTFNQTMGNAAILNRVTGGVRSQIHGNLSSNCPIYLVNPQGILIASTADIQTAGLIASTADLSNTQFLSDNEILFSQFGVGKIQNLGRIHATEGDVLLIARKVENSGKIKASHGSVLFTTSEVLVHPGEKKHVYIRVGDETQDEKGIENLGDIEALSVEFKTKSPYHKAIHHKGTIHSLTAKEENGRIYLVADKGTNIIDGSLSAPSGEVHVLGKTVSLQKNTTIDVSGPSGGTVLVGGDYQGKNPEILNADNVIVHPGARVLASSTGSGNGGKVIYWSDRITAVAGLTEVRGGPEGGDGGFIEVSGLKGFVYLGKSDRTAPFGKWGTILFDPEYDVTISNGAQTPFTTVGTPSNVTLLPTTQPAVLNNIPTDTLLTELGSGNVTIKTFNAAGPGGGVGNLTFSDPFTWNANSLTCDVGNTATITANITNTGTGNFTVIAQRNIAISGATVSSTSTTTGGNITLTALGTLGGSPNDNFTGLNLVNGQIQTDVGTISLSGIGGTGGTGNRGVGIGTGFVVQSNSGSINLYGEGRSTLSQCDGVLIGGNSSILSTSGNIQVTGIAPTNQGIQTGPTTISTGGTGNITLRGSGGDPGTLIQNGTIVQTAQGNIHIEGSGTVNGVHISGNSNVHSIAGGNIEIFGQATNSKGIYFTSGGKVSVSGSGSISVNGVGSETGPNNSYGVLIQDSGTTLSAQTGPITIKGTGRGSTKEGVVVSNSGSVVSTGNAPITIQTFSDILIQSNGSVEAQGGGDLFLIAADNITIESTGSVKTNAGNLFVVVDNKFPKFPNLGGSSFTLEPGAILSSGGELRIYTSRRSQNSINELINGAAFIPAARGKNTKTETWSTYFFDGKYGGAPFNIYYKEPIIFASTFRMFYENIAANLTELSDLLPNLKSARIPFSFPSYHFALCNEERWAKWKHLKKRWICDPTLSPYGSFIFEDALWWIKENE
ncbi:MAG: filamentous hemagglutinin N-terminal domain-containing protein [Chlamydiales bacterium]|nr:filamentous hemagglutinin N-terminal domain-containing protein [Chlamydiales bacterium]